MFSEKKTIMVFVILTLIIISILSFIYIKEDIGIKQSEKVSSSEFIMDTIVKIEVYGVDADKVIKKSFARLREIESKMSRSLEKSDVSRINKNAGDKWVKVDEDSFEVIEKAIHYAELTEGDFDPSIGPLVSLWNIGNPEQKVPSEEEIKKAKSLVNYNFIKTDKKNNKIKLAKEGMKIDLGAIAKGYAADEVRDIIDDYNIENAIITLGGNILVIGDKKDGTEWKIGIQDPRKSRGSVMASLNLKDETVVTSGNYERYFEKDGIIYHHILDPETGKPSRNNLLSVSIIAKDSIDADALSTSAFIMGKEKGMKMIEDLDDTEAIFIRDDLKVFISSGLSSKVKILDNDFSLY